MSQRGWQVLSEGGLRIRAAPVSDAPTKGILPKGTIVVAVEKRGHWIRHAQGWSLMRNDQKHFVKQCSVKWQVLSPGGLRVRSDPNGEPTGVLPTTAVVIALQIHEVPNAFWVRHEQGWSMGGQDGRVFLTDHIIPPWQPQASRWYVLSDGGLRIRAAPSLSATAFGILPKDAEVTVLERKDDWIHHERGWSLICAKGKMFLAEVKSNSANAQRASLAAPAEPLTDSALAATASEAKLSPLADDPNPGASPTPTLAGSASSTAAADSVDDSDFVPVSAPTPALGPAGGAGPQAVGVDVSASGPC